MIFYHYNNLRSARVEALHIDLDGFLRFSGGIL